MKDNEEIEYIAKHYRPGRFVVKTALQRIKPDTKRKWTPIRIAASLAAIIALSATAAVLVHNDFFKRAEVTPEVQSNRSVPVETIVKVIDFEETPLPVVVDKIKEVYGVEVTGLPDNAEEYALSLHYEGSANDLLETINEILSTDMIIER